MCQIITIVVYHIPNPPLPRYKKNTKIYEKASLASSIEKIYQAVVLIETYNDNELKSNGTGFIYKVDDKYGYIV